MQCTAERANSYVGNKGPVNQVIISLTDKTKTGARLGHVIEKVLTPDEKAQYAGKILDKNLVVDFTKFETWAGAVRGEGAIVQVVGNGS